MVRGLRSGMLMCLTGFGASVNAFQAKNPPGCAVDFADMAADITAMADGIIKNTEECAEKYITGTNETKVNAKICTNAVFGTVSTFLDVVADIESGIFDCWRVNQGCGQTIASAAGYILDLAGYLIQTTIACEPATASQEPAVKGFACWAKIWKVVKSGVKGAKYVDEALVSCGSTAKLAPQSHSVETGVEPVLKPAPPAVVAPIEPIIELPPAGSPVVLPGHLPQMDMPVDPASVMLLAEFPNNAVERRLDSRLRGGLGVSRDSESEGEESAVDLHAKLEHLKSRFAKIFGRRWQPSRVDDEDDAEAGKRDEADQVMRYYERKKARAMHPSNEIEV